MSGTGLCRAATDYCRGNRMPAGEDNPDTGRWNHINVIGGPAWKAVKGSSYRLFQGRAAEQGACPATAGNTTGDVNDRRIQEATEDNMEAMHRRCVQAGPHRRCVRVASNRKNSEKQDLLPD